MKWIIKLLGGYTQEDRQKIVDFYEGALEASRNFEVKEKVVTNTVYVEKPKPLPKHKVIEEIEVDYILGELMRGIDDAMVKKQTYDDLRQMLPLSLQLLTDLVSRKYRKNAVYDCLYERGYSWTQEDVDFKQIYLTKINEKTNAVLEKLKRPYNLLDLIASYKRKELPEGFELTNNPSKPIGFKPMLIFSEGKYQVIDGNHRITSLALNTKGKITAFVGKKGVK